MIYEYRMVIDNPAKVNGVENFPPQVVYSDWYQKMTAIFPALANRTPTNNNILLLRKLFKTSELLENFLAETKLNDPELLTVLSEWKREYGIIVTERVEEIPEYIPRNPKLLD